MVGYRLRLQKQKIKIGASLAALALLIAPLIAPVVANAAQLTSRSLTLSTSAASATASHTFGFTIPTTASIGSIQFLYCTAASGACTTPTGLSTTAATLTAQSGATGFTLNNTTNGAPFITRTAASITSGTAVSYTLGAITNPSTTNTTFFVRVTTFTGSDGVTGPTDTGNVAASTSNSINVSGSVDETLTFCTGTTGITGTSCTGATGSTVSLGSLSPTSTGSGTSQIGVSTNASSGYSVTVNGTTLTSGANTITALATQAASTQGSEQFGINLRDNATPNVGADPAGTGTANPTANYNTADQYRFVSGDVIASSAAADSHRFFTVSYIANVASATEAGTYSSALNYVATATF